MSAANRNDVNQLLELFDPIRPCGDAAPAPPRSQPELAARRRGYDHRRAPPG